jgi:hypothetical protein
MKKLLFFLMLLKSQTIFTQSILFDPLGANDKTFFSLRFINDTITQTGKNSHSLIIEKWVNLNKKDFKILQKIVFKNRTKISNINKNQYVFGAFKVQFDQKGKAKSYYLLEKYTALEYFSKLSDILNKSNKNYIAKEFDYFIERIKPVTMKSSK